jgi:hypothetical protein
MTLFHANVQISNDFALTIYIVILVESRAAASYPRTLRLLLLLCSSTLSSQVFTPLFHSTGGSVSARHHRAQ